MFRFLLMTGLITLVVLMGVAAYHESHRDQPALRAPQTGEQDRQMGVRVLCAAKLGLGATGAWSDHQTTAYARCLYETGY